MLTERFTNAEIAIRECCADLMAEVEQATDINQQFTHWRKLRELENYVKRIGDAAAEHTESTATRQ